MDPIRVMLETIRMAVNHCKKPSEREVLEALIEESEVWQMRLDEIDEDEELSK